MVGEIFEGVFAEMFIEHLCSCQGGPSDHVKFTKTQGVKTAIWCLIQDYSSVNLSGSNIRLVYT